MIPAAAKAASSTPSILPRFLTQSEISPLQYGQFIEYLGDLVPGMWSEKVADGSFEGLGTWDQKFIAATDRRDRPWYPAGQVNRADYALDTQDPVSGAVSQRIRVIGERPCTVGIAQDGLDIAAGEAMDVSCWLRGASGDGKVTIELLGREGALATCAFEVTATWGKRRARLVPSSGCHDATIRISFKGPGTLWIDNVSLMPIDSVDGWRRDVFESVKALRPGVIRYGGCAVDNTTDEKHFAWDWDDSVGEPDRRKPFWAWGGLQPTGPGLEEIVRFIRAVGAEPILTVRVTRSTPARAAEMVEYFNGSADTPMGRRRAANGHPEPYAIRYWQVGNELIGAAYEAVLPEFCRAMRAVDPGISLLSSWPTDATAGAAAGQVDYLCPHHYGVANLTACAADIDTNAARCAVAADPLELAITEWNTTAGEFGPGRAGLWSLANALACARYRNLLHRRCDVVAIANRSNLVNSLCAGVIQTVGSRMFTTPTYHVDRLYATLAGDRSLAVQVTDGGSLDISATYRGGADPALTLFVVNDGCAPATGGIDLGGFAGLGREARVWTLADRERAGEPDAVNSFLEPDRIAPVEGTARIVDGRLVHDFPALSLSVVRIGVATLS